MSKEISFQILYCLGANFKALAQHYPEYANNIDYMKELDQKRDLILIRALCRIRYSIIRFPEHYEADFVSNIREYLSREYETVCKYKINLAPVGSKPSLVDVVNDISSHINSLSQGLLRNLNIPKCESVDILFKFPMINSDTFREMSEIPSTFYSYYKILIPCLLHIDYPNIDTMFYNDNNLYAVLSFLTGRNLTNNICEVKVPEGNIGVYVDCENTNIITIMKLLKFLEPVKNNVQLKLFIDSYKGRLWKSIESLVGTDMKLTKVFINRITPSKSSLDVALASAVVSDVYNEKLDSVMLVSSDCDFYNMLLTIRDRVETYVVYSQGAVSTRYIMNLCAAGGIQTMEASVLTDKKNSYNLYKKGIDYSIICYASQCTLKHFDKTELMKELQNTLGKEVIINEEVVQNSLDNLTISYKLDSLVFTIDDLTITDRKDD